MTRWKWTDRKFTFDFPPSKWPDLLERVRGAPVRLESMVARIEESILEKSNGHGWTAKQNIGHLIDLGYLPTTRIDQILRGEETLIGADMTNAKTNGADHNNTPIAQLVQRFTDERDALVKKFESLDESDWEKSALHPRLNQPMRIVDIAYFDAEHDDYHLSRIRQLIQEYNWTE